MNLSLKYKAVYVVLLALTLSSLACYSDSPLWWNDLTATPAPPTPIPTPQAGQARYEIGSTLVIVNPSGLPVIPTNFPEPLKADSSNRAPQSCSLNMSVRVLYRGVTHQGELYYLIDCNGSVGWVPESNLLGPINLRVNDRALTTEAGVNETGAFKIEASDPPYAASGTFRQTFDCRVNDTVDVIGLAGFATGELYYKIRCTNPINPITPNIGWTTPAALFGPVRFRNGEIGIVPDTPIELRAAADDGEVVATCEPGELVTITDQPVQRHENALFYEMACAAGIGWANQEMLIGPVRYPVGMHVLVTAPPLAETPSSTEATAEPIAATMPLTLEPDVTSEQVGACADATLTTIEALAGTADTLYTQVTCEGITGWLNSDFLYGEAKYELGETVMLGEKALLGFNQQGIFLSLEIFDIQGSSGGSSVIAGECAFDFTTNAPVAAQLTDVGYYRSSVGSIVGIFYKAQCQDRNGSTIEGWINQNRIGE